VGREVRAITYEELAERKGIRLSRRRIQQLMKEGKFPKSLRHGRMRYWIESAIDDWLTKSGPWAGE
jgi:predicted DNA-binding transcriptional regulator AlpA